VAVVGTGLDQVYPRQHLGLSQDIAACGWVISELPLGTQPLAHHFPQRNRLIAGLSQGVLVVEAALKSGSLITAQLALDQGKEVFAIPGSIHSALSRGCHALLRQGAKLVENTHDIVEEMPPINGLPLPPWQAEVPDVLQKPDAQALWSVMGDEALSVDVLVLRSGMTVPQVLAVLHELQEHACVAMNSGGSYQRIQRSKV
jgi:DNA processing protein